MNTNKLDTAIRNIEVALANLRSARHTPTIVVPAHIPPIPAPLPATVVRKPTIPGATTWAPDPNSRQARIRSLLAAGLTTWEKAEGPLRATHPWPDRLRNAVRGQFRKEMQRAGLLEKRDKTGRPAGTKNPPVTRKGQSLYSRVLADVRAGMSDDGIVKAYPGHRSVRVYLSLIRQALGSAGAGTTG